MILTWVILGLIAVSAGVITLSVMITASEIIKLMKSDTDGFEKSFATTIEEKLNEEGHTTIKVKVTDIYGGVKHREIRSDQGCDLRVGQTIKKY